MANIEFEIQGQGAVAAAEELLSIPGLSGNYEVDNTQAEREGTLATIATIVGIVGGTVALAEQIRKWYTEYKQGKSGAKIEKVFIVRNGEYLVLENATIKDIQKILES